MIRALILAVIGAACWVTANGQTAAAHVSLVVEPTLELTVLTEPTELLTPLLPEVTATAQYHLSTNSSAVYLAGLATVCQSEDATEIPLNMARGVTIESGGMFGPENVAYAYSDGYGGLSGQRTEWGRYESTGAINTDVWLSAGWRPDLDQAPGTYNGWLVLYAILEP